MLVEWRIREVASDLEAPEKCLPLRMMGKRQGYTVHGRGSESLTVVDVQ